MTRYLIILLLLTSCTKVDLSYTVHAGENNFTPLTPTLPFAGREFESTIQIGQEWFDGPLTTPEGFGVKLHCIGKWNYHEGGCNFAISYSEGKCYLSSRYYEPITSGTYLLHEGLSQTEIYPNIPINYRITFTDSTRFYVASQLVATVMLLPHDWITPPFLGRSGRDQNYPGGDIPGAWAVRELTLKIIK